MVKVSKRMEHPRPLHPWKVKRHEVIFESDTTAGKVNRNFKLPTTAHVAIAAKKGTTQMLLFVNFVGKNYKPTR
jgi:hypothetical protein